MMSIHLTVLFSGEIGEPKIEKSYNDVTANNHWRIQDLINAMISSGFTIKQVEEMQAVDASFWFRYDELITKTEDELVKVNDWRYNPMSALPAWITICMQKVQKRLAADNLTTLTYHKP